jgi:biopolymer transport protein ExbD
MRKRRHAMHRERPRLEIVPMIDIMMFLLVFFVMIVLRMIPDSGVTLSLPGAATAQSLPHTDVVVILDAQNQMHVNNEIVSADQLSAYLITEKETHNTDVIVAGDKNTPLQQMMNVMDIARKCGITDIGIATKPQ